jgi:hypothetical protein
VDDGAGLHHHPPVPRTGRTGSTDRRAFLSDREQGTGQKQLVQSSPTPMIVTGMCRHRCLSIGAGIRSAESRMLSCANQPAESRCSCERDDSNTDEASAATSRWGKWVARQHDRQLPCLAAAEPVLPSERREAQQSKNQKESCVGAGMVMTRNVQRCRQKASMSNQRKAKQTRHSTPYVPSDHGACDETCGGTARQTKLAVQSVLRCGAILRGTRP